jgi:outer membrane protein assembly factor BamB
MFNKTPLTRYKLVLTTFAISQIIAVLSASLLANLSAPFLFPTTALAQPAKQASGVQKKDNPLASIFRFSADGISYVVKDEKIFIGKNTKGILLTKEGNIEKLYYLPNSGDLILFYGMSSGGEGWGEIIRIAASSGQIKWRTHMPAFNVGQPLQEKEAVYVTGVGFIAKLNLTTGKYIWQKANYEKYKIDAFSLPVIKGNQVIFKEEPSVAINLQPKTLVVDKGNGNIIKFINP